MDKPTVTAPQFPTDRMRDAFLREFTSPANFERAYVAMFEAWKKEAKG